jgi:hypothetical protein
MHRFMKAKPSSRYFLILPLIAAWSVGFAFTRINPYGSLSGRPQYSPTLPTVAAAPGSGRSDVVSVVPFLFKGLAVAALCFLIVEPAKFGLGRSGRQLLWFPVLLCYQVLLFLDIVRFFASDWLTYLLHFLGLHRLDESSYDFARLVVARGAPWPSFALMLLLVGIAATRPGKALPAVDESAMTARPPQADSTTPSAL